MPTFTHNIVNSYELRVAAAPYWIIPGAVPSTLAQLLQAPGCIQMTLLPAILYPNFY